MEFTMEKTRKIQTKLLIPVMISLGVAAILIAVVIFSSARNHMNDFISRDAAANTNLIHHNLQKTIQSAISTASIYASYPGVAEAYREKDTVEARNLLKKALSGKLNVRLHFHRPPAISFWRSWEKGKKEGGDNLAGFRQSVLEIMRSQKEVRGIEVGRGGFEIRGIVPVFDRGEFAGSVENLRSFNAVFENLLIDSLDNVLVFSGTQVASLAWNLQNLKAVGDFKKVYSLRNETDSIPLSVLQNGWKGMNTEIIGNKAVTGFPVLDFSGKTIGVICYLKDISGQKRMEYTYSFIILGILILVLLVVFLTIRWISRRVVTEPIARIQSMISRLSAGDLAVEFEFIKGNDEIGRMASELNSMVKRLSSFVRDIHQAADLLTEAGLSLSRVSGTMAESAQIQRTSLTELISSTDLMVSTMRKNMKDAARAMEIAHEANSKIREGSEVAVQTVEAMEKIAEKAFMINDIAYHTNILSLNTSVEAARAGALGKGFAVLAGEVRKLSEQSKASAKEIERLIENGSKLSETAGKKLAEVVPSISMTAGMVHSISLSSEHQVQSAEEMTEAIHGLQSGAVEQVSISDEILTNAQSLTMQAKKLKEMTTYFSIRENRRLSSQ
jgi:methyl-accepting chemotaxis protein